ncbi:hypothetical protein R80B4_01842 [Fibrobacteres bacterium R8-0-B4]
MNNTFPSLDFVRLKNAEEFEFHTEILATAVEATPAAHPTNPNSDRCVHHSDSVYNYPLTNYLLLKGECRMKIFTLTKLGRTLLPAAAMVGALWLSGCGGDSGENNSIGGTTPGTTPGGGNNTIVNNNCTSGATCKSKQMPDGKTWMTENLNIATADSWCYRDSNSYCNEYGRLYTWNAARTACPSGWHLPSRQEWSGLVTAAGGENAAGGKLKSTSGWYVNGYNNGGGTDEFGFSALSGGERLSDGRFSFESVNGFWWTATEQGSDNAYLWYISSNSNGISENYGDKSRSRSVRCMRN